MDLFSLILEALNFPPNSKEREEVLSEIRVIIEETSSVLNELEPKHEVVHNSKTRKPDFSKPLSYICLDVRCLGRAAYPEQIKHSPNCLARRRKEILEKLNIKI